MGSGSLAAGGTLDWDEFVAGIGLGMVVHDGHGAVLAANRRAAQLLGVRRAELFSGVRPAGWRARDELGARLPHLAELARQVLRGGTATAVPFVVTPPHGPNRRLWAEIRPVRHRDGLLSLTVLHPVEVDLWRSLGLVDPLTGLANQLLLIERLTHGLTMARALGGRVSLVLLDVRGLGELNESLGVTRADELLAKLGRRLRDGLREDQTVARYAGGTFAVVANHPRGTGEPVASRAQSLAGAGDGPGLAVRTGWATSDGGESADELISRALALLGEA